MQPTLVFDLDGTLAHTAPDLIATLNRICAPHGLPEIPFDKVGQIVGHGAKAMIERAFALNHRQVREPEMEELFTAFLADYTDNIAVETHLFEGIEALLPELTGEGHTLCVCTNKREDMARILLRELNIDQYFSAVSGGDSFTFKKPDGRHILETVALAGVPSGQIIMIGDSATDIGAARHADIPSIAVTFGYSDQPVEELGATKIISHFDELRHAVSDIAKVG